MESFFIAEISMFAGNFAPRGWALCNGQLLAISGNSALFSLVGTIYGGDGRTTFGLPDLRGRVPIHKGTGAGLPSYSLGSKGGAVNTTFTTATMPSHSHTVAIGVSDQPGDTNDPSGNVLAVTENNSYSTGAPVASQKLGETTTNDVGGSSQFSTVQPFLCVNYIISLTGIYPSRN